MMYLLLFVEFFKIGLFSIGGGLATFPFLQDLAQRYDWMTAHDLLDMIAISESTPGPIGINTATFVGYQCGGILGGIIATLGIISPSIIIIVLVAHYYMKFSEQTIVRSTLDGIRPAVVGLIGAAGFEVAKVSLLNINKFLQSNNFFELFNFKSILLFIIMLYLIFKYKKHPILYIIASGIIGIILKY
ncbi:chromate transporter [Defluviitalea phaphyphila]|uniref:chromate transporter n=1 Tax=Defluviitalea phaphyphila TaxID=1473580 RepID=UPI0007316578|nr:chromate transporter [Defluviitalea phaphyphila]